MAEKAGKSSLIACSRVVMLVVLSFPAFARDVN